MQVVWWCSRIAKCVEPAEMVTSLGEAHTPLLFGHLCHLLRSLGQWLVANVWQEALGVSLQPSQEVSLEGRGCRKAHQLYAFQVGRQLGEGRQVPESHSMEWQPS